ncbi:MAG: hypothetical protein NZ556_05115, partial [Fimbriimonadales bacterium]|nr:hypothetical protein [Fimbriimonadales bacterium]
VRQEMREGFERVDREFENVRQEMREGFERVDREFENVRQEMREGFERVDREFENVRQEMREGFERVEAKIKRNTEDIAELKGVSLEQKYRNQARSIFSRLLKNPRVIDFPEIEERISPEPPLSEREHDDLVETDMFVMGVDRDTGNEAIMAVEVSWKVDVTDVERAVRRARLIASRGVPAGAVAAGREATEGALELAPQLGCGILLTERFELKPSITAAS